MDTLENQKPASLFKADGRLSVTVAADVAEGLRVYLRFHSINATPADDAEGEHATLRIDDNVDEDVLQPLIDWNREVYGTSDSSGPSQEE